jgi:hypothetical protein
MELAPAQINNHSVIVATTQSSGLKSPKGFQETDRYGRKKRRFFPADPKPNSPSSMAFLGAKKLPSDTVSFAPRKPAKLQSSLAF